MAPFLDRDLQLPSSGSGGLPPLPPDRGQDRYLSACGHVWPDELTPDAECMLGCGTAYGEWTADDR